MPVFDKGQTHSRCTKCGKVKPVSEYFIKHHKKNGDIMYRPWCKKCFNIQRLKSKRKWKRSMTDKEYEVVDCATLRRCTKCLHLKPIKEFYRDRIINGRQLYLYICKECFKEHKKKFDNPERIKAKRLERKLLMSKVFNKKVFLRKASRILTIIKKTLISIEKEERKLLTIIAKEDSKISNFLIKEKIRLDKLKKIKAEIKNKKLLKLKRKEAKEAKDRRREMRLQRKKVG